MYHISPVKIAASVAAIFIYLKQNYFFSVFFSHG